MNNTKKLLKLIEENPDLDVVPMVDCDVVADDYGYWMGSWGSPRIDYIHIPDKRTSKFLNEERIYFKSSDEEDIKDNIFNWLEVKKPNVSDEELEKMTDKAYEEEIDWKKTIVVYIGLPNY